MDYMKMAALFKALSNSSRLKIVNLVSCGELCACEILEYFDFSQPTLSHHMKVLETAGIVISEKRGKWNYYTLSEEFVLNFTADIEELVLNNGEDCICSEIRKESLKTNQTASEII